MDCNEENAICIKCSCYEKTPCKMIRNAIFNGHLGCLKYAHLEQGGSLQDLAITYYAARYEYIDCLEYALENDAPFNHFVTRDLALDGNVKCLRYIYEQCGDVHTWKSANLERDFEKFKPEIQEYINSIREDWKHGLNRKGSRTKSAK